MTLTEHAEQILRETECKLIDLANSYAREVIHPFCDKYDLIFSQLGYTWEFYFKEPEKTGKYPFAIDAALLNWLKSGYDLDSAEDKYLKYEIVLGELSYNFRYDLENILRVIDCNLNVLGYVQMGKFIPSYPTQ